MDRFILTLPICSRYYHHTPFNSDLRFQVSDSFKNASKNPRGCRHAAEWFQKRYTGTRSACFSILTSIMVRFPDLRPHPNPGGVAHSGERIFHHPSRSQMKGPGRGKASDTTRTPSRRLVCPFLLWAEYPQSGATLPDSSTSAPGAARTVHRAAHSTSER